MPKIHSPAGKVFVVANKPLSAKTDENEVYKLWYQACLLDVLFEQNNEQGKLMTAHLKT